MKVRIDTAEQTKGMLSSKTVYVLSVKIELTPDEARVEPISGNPVQDLTDPYSEDDQLKGNFIRWSDAIGRGDQQTLMSAGQMQECEEKLKERCKQIQQHLDGMVDYKVTKQYVFDPKAEG